MGRITYKVYKRPEFRKVIHKIHWKKRGGTSTVTTPSSTGNNFDGWILTNGIWDDTGYWRDTAHWQDVSYL